MPIKVAIVDDDRAVRTNLADTVNGYDGCRCVGQFASAAEALTGIPAAQPEVVLMDINLGTVNGIECVRQLKQSHPEIEFVMLTVYEDAERVFDALAAGASGYLLKRTLPDELREAIVQVHAGGSPMTSHIARKVVQAFHQPAPRESGSAALSAREQEVLQLLAHGLLYKEIAESLKISYATVHNHIRHIYEKLQVRSRSQASARYFGQHPKGAPEPLERKQ